MKFFRIGDDQKPPVSCGGGWHEGDDPARQRLGRTLRRPTLRTSSRVVTVSTEVFSSGNCSAKQGFAIAKRLRKHTFWYEITMVSWLFRTEKHIWNKAGLICLFYTHLWHFKTPFIKFFSDSTPPRQHSSAFGLPPLPPSSAMVSIWLTPPPPLVSFRQHLLDAPFVLQFFT